MSEAQLSKINTVLLVGVVVLLLLNLYWKHEPKPAGRFQQVGSPRMALDTKTGKLCSTVDIPYDRFKVAEVEGSTTFEVPDDWDQTRIQSYLKSYRAGDPEAFQQPGRKQFRVEFDPNPIPMCAHLE